MAAEQTPELTNIGSIVWAPILVDDLAAYALDAVGAIESAIRARQLPENRGASIAFGNAGYALFHAYAAQTLGGSKRVRRAIRVLEQAAIITEKHALSAGLYSGFPGVAWATEHVHLTLIGERLDIAEPDQNTEIDDVLVEFTSRPGWLMYELLGGLAGLGVYALKRLPHDSAWTLLRQVIIRLDELAERSADGISWHTARYHLPPAIADRFPHGMYNLGLAHGVPGVIAFLAQVYSAGVDRDKVGELLSGAVEWLLARSLPDCTRGHFPTVVHGYNASAPARLAWCYGDAGIAVALCAAGRATSTTSWENEGLAIARDATSRDFEDSGVVDGGLCHGAAGVAHVFNHLYQIYGQERLKIAAIQWVERTLSFRKPGSGSGGFASFSPAQESTHEPARWVNDPSLLTGAAGIGLVLLSAISTVIPEWGALFLMPPASRSNCLVLHAS